MTVAGASDQWRCVVLSGLGGFTMRFDVATAGSAVGSIEVIAVGLREQRPALLDAVECGRIAEYLEAVITADLPELDVPALCLAGSGITLDAVGSDELTTEFSLVLPQRLHPPAAGAQGVQEVNFRTSRLALANAARRFRNEPDVVDHPDPTGTGLFAEPDASASALIWALATPPEGSRQNGVSPAAVGASDPGGDVAMLRGYIFSPDCDPEIEFEVLRVHAGPAAVGQVTGELPDGLRFGLLLVQADWLTQMTFDALAAHGDLTVAAAIAAALAPAESLVPYSACVGYRMIDLEVISTYLASQYEWDLSEDLTLFAALQALLAETCRVGLDRILAGRQAGCAFPGRLHNCQHDACTDVFVAWNEGAELFHEGILPVRLPCRDDPFDALHLRRTTSAITGELRRVRTWSLPDDPSWHLDMFAELGSGNRRDGMRRAMRDPVYRPIPADLLVALQEAVFGADQVDMAPSPARARGPRPRRSGFPSTSHRLGAPSYVSDLENQLGPWPGQPPELASVFELADQADLAELAGDSAAGLGALEQATVLLKALLGAGRAGRSPGAVAVVIDRWEAVLDAAERGEPDGG